MIAPTSDKPHAILHNTSDFDCLSSLGSAGSFLLGFIQMLSPLYCPASTVAAAAVIDCAVRDLDVVASITATSRLSLLLFCSKSCPCFRRPLSSSPMGLLTIVRFLFLDCLGQLQRKCVWLELFLHMQALLVAPCRHTDRTSGCGLFS